MKAQPVMKERRQLRATPIELRPEAVPESRFQAVARPGLAFPGNNPRGDEPGRQPTLTQQGKRGNGLVPLVQWTGDSDQYRTPAVWEHERHEDRHAACLALVRRSRGHPTRRRARGSGRTKRLLPIGLVSVPCSLSSRSVLVKDV